MVEIVPAQACHMDQVVQVFCQAFGESIAFFLKGEARAEKALKDIFTLLVQVFGPGFMAAVKKGQVLGYIIMVPDIRKLWTGCFFSGLAWKILGRAITGAYGLGILELVRISRNKLAYMSFEMKTPEAAQILSVAVHPQYQGQGVGKKLIRRGLDYIDKMGLGKIKLEVRLNNKVALKLYEEFGFTPQGKMRDLQGDWLVMIRETQISKKYP